MFQAHLSFLLLLLLTGTLGKKYLSSNDYLGCYKDEKEKGRDLPFRPQSRSHNRGDALSCILNCGESGFIFAGLQNGNLCFCGNKYGNYGRVSDGNCNMKCLKPEGDQTIKFTDNVNDSCGGKWLNSVYAVRGIKYQDVKPSKRKKSK